MSDGETAYKYNIPLEEQNGSESPVYDTPTAGERLSTVFRAETLEVVQTESAPHFHKDEVNVQVEEVSKEEYTG